MEAGLDDLPGFKRVAEGGAERRLRKGVLTDVRDDLVEPPEDGKTFAATHRFAQGRTISKVPSLALAPPITSRTPAKSTIDSWGCAL